MATYFQACSIDGCGRNADWRAKVCKGYCCRHYERLRRYGNPLAGRQTMDGEPLRWINDVAVHYAGGDCLSWPYTKDSRGYGSVKVNRKMVGAHRYICKLVHGAPPTPAHEATHKCGKGHLGCVNPNHLEWKTHAGNMADMVEHGRSTRGYRQGRSKLTEEQVLEIRALKGVKTQREIAADYGVSVGHVGNIKAGTIWAWLGENAP